MADEFPARGPADHGLRVALSEIMHGRSLKVAKTPARVRQWLVLHDTSDHGALDVWISTLSGGTLSVADGHFASESEGELRVWEAHTEFSIITLVRSGASSREPIGDCAWLDGLPGQIFRSVEIVIGARADFEQDEAACFDPSRVVSSLAFGGAARIWSDFTIKGSGAGKILIEDMGLQNDEPSRLVQTLLEIGNYRKLALLGFPVARDLMPWITAAEARHARITERMNTPSGNRADILHELLDLSAEVECRAGRARFRLGATSSYHLLARDRLSALREIRSPGYSTWSEFIERRLLPAMRTCEISQSRLDRLSERINRTASLLSLEQTVALNKQSQASLASMNRRAMLQLRLQSLVEGLSVFAVSYYVIGLIDHLLDPLLELGNVKQMKSAALGMIVPLVLSGAWIMSSRRRLRANTPVTSERP